MKERYSEFYYVWNWICEFRGTLGTPLSELEKATALEF